MCLLNSLNSFYLAGISESLRMWTGSVTRSVTVTQDHNTTVSHRLLLLQNVCWVSRIYSIFLLVYVYIM